MVPLNHILRKCAGGYKLTAVPADFRVKLKESRERERERESARESEREREREREREKERST